MTFTESGMWTSCRDSHHEKAASPICVTDSGIVRKSGDTLTFKVRYSNMLYAFSGRHVTIAYHSEI